MPKKKTSKILIGLFVLTGSMIGVAAVIWLGASKYFETGETYLAYFDESVQGLNSDSSVKMRGVSIGRVDKINVRADSALVEVVMKLHPRERLHKDVCAELKSLGLTGIMFIDLDLKKPGEKLDGPPAGYRPAFTVIPSRPSKMKQITAGIDVILDKLNGIKTDKIIGNLESAAAHLDKTLGRTDRLLADERIGQILSNTKDTLAEARSTLSGFRAEIKDVRIRETTGQAQRFLEGVEKDTRRIATDLKATGENMRRVSENLDMMMERIQDDPSELLFSSPPQPRQGRGDVQ
jgi:phospholipid/cholesterol/gamma-HCH transport system substrate-binding protein